MDGSLPSFRRAWASTEEVITFGDFGEAPCALCWRKNDGEEEEYVTLEAGQDSWRILQEVLPELAKCDPLRTITPEEFIIILESLGLVDATID